jgi:signal transduction histidine kinase
MGESNEAQLSLEQELKHLRKENRRLKRELEAAQMQMRRTDELYRTSERVLTRAYHDLEEAVLRSRDIQEELNRTSKLAAVGELAARVVHEVLNPMTSLLGRLQGMIRRHELSSESNPVVLLEEILGEWESLYRQGGLPEYLRTPGEGGLTLYEEDLEDCGVVVKSLHENLRVTLDDLKFLERTSLHMVKIINSMRSLSRSRADVTHVHVNGLLVDSIELLRDALRRGGIVVRERYGRDLPRVYADPSELIQIFTNIVRNAQQAIGRGGTIDIETSARNGRVEIRIADNGPGVSLPPDQIDLIFEGGFTTRPREEGTGLGLAICRRFARTYHGDVEVEWTAPGEGIRFLIWLPIRQTPEALAGDGSTVSDPLVPEPVGEGGRPPPAWTMGGLRAEMAL